MEGMKDANKNDPTEPERIEFIIKNVTVNSFVYDEEYDVLCYATSDGILTLMTTSGGSKPYLKIPAIEEAEITSLWLAKNLQVLFAGTNQGSIRVYLWPIIVSKLAPDEEPEYAEFWIHATKITSLEVTYDKRFLISTSEDGSVFFLKIYEFYNGVDFNSNISNIQTADPLKKRQYYQSQKCKVHLHMNSLSLVFKSALDQKAHQIQELKYKAENLKAYYQEERNSTANKFAEEINNLNVKSGRDTEKDELEEKYDTYWVWLIYVCCF